jgi:HlyD family secretion protein
MGGANGRPAGDRSAHTVYLLVRGSDGAQTAKPVQIKTGINDGIYTQVLEGLKEGDQIIEGENLSMEAMQAGQSNPFGGGQRRF